MLKPQSKLRKRVIELTESKRQGQGSAVIRMARRGELHKLRPGVYRVVGGEIWMHQDLIDACTAVPEGVICLISALAYHGLTTAIPSETWMAIPRNAWAPRLTFPTRFIRMNDQALAAGVETHPLGGKKIRITSKAKTVCDALRFRDKIGQEVALEALKNYLRSGGSANDLMQWETVCRVRGILRSYLEAMLA